MNEDLTSFLTEYFQIWLGVDSLPKGLVHNQQWKEFISTKLPSSILLKYDANNNRFVIEGEVSEAMYFLFTKQEGILNELNSSTLMDSLSIYCFEKMIEAEKMMLEQLSTYMNQPKPKTDSEIFNNLSEIIKSDLFSDEAFINSSQPTRDGSGQPSLETQKNTDLTSMIFTVEDEIRYNKKVIEYSDHNTPEVVVPTSEKAIQILTPLLPYVANNDNYTPQETKQASELFIISLKGLFGLETYNQGRTLRLIQIMSDIIVTRAMKANRNFDIFDYDDCNLRLRLSMWFDIMKNFMSKAYKIVDELRGKAKPLPDVVKYQSFKKKLSTATYLRGIYDELIRFCKLKRHVECDQKLQKFNMKRKEEKKSPKEEREEFFKLFGNYTMEIIAYIGKELVPEMDTNPRSALLQIRKWNNSLNLKSKHDLVKSIRTRVQEKIKLLFDQWEQELDQPKDVKTSSGVKLSKEMRDLTSWARLRKEFIETRELYFEINSEAELSAAGDSSAGNAKWNEIKGRIKTRGQELMKKWEDIYYQIKRQRPEAFEIMMCNCLGFSINREGHLNIDLEETGARFYQEVRQFRSLGLEDMGISNREIEHIISDFEKYRTGAIGLKQATIHYNFVLEGATECLIPLIRESSQSKELIDTFKTRLKNGKITINSTQSYKIFVSKVIGLLEEFKRKSEKLEDGFNGNILELKKLGNYNLVSVRDFIIWKEKKMKVEASVKELSEGSSPEVAESIKKEAAGTLKGVMLKRAKTVLRNYNEFMKEKEVTLRLKDRKIEADVDLEELRTQWTEQLQAIRNNWTDIANFEEEEYKDELKIAEAYIEEEVEKVQESYTSARPQELWDLEEIPKLADQINSEAASKKQDQDQDKGIDQDQPKEEKKKGPSGPGIVEQITEARSLVDKVPESIKKGRFSLQLSKLKADYVELLLDMREEIAQALNSSLNTDVQSINDFILSSQVFLKSKPDTFEGLDSMRKQYNVLKEKFDENVVRLNSLDTRMSMVKDLELASVAEINLPNLRRKWDNFSLKFSCFSQILKNGEKQIMTGIKHELKKMNNVLDKFYEKIKGVDISSKKNLTKDEEERFADTMKDINEEWVEIQAEIGPHLKTIEQYDLDVSDLTSLQAVLDYFKGPFAEWKVYFDYVGGMEGMAQEEWLSFKPNVYDFHKYVNEWFEKVDGKEGKSYQFVRESCLFYKEIWPTLKVMVGEGFQRSHWAELYELVGIHKKRALTDLTFKDLLAKKSNIMKKQDEIKFLASKALGEVALREALADLQTWCDTTKYEFTEFVDQQNVEVQIVKEWSDIITRVSENQVMLQSVRDSKYSAGFMDILGSFEHKLSGLDDNLLKLNQVQRRWVYLEPVFGRGALPSEQGRFRRVDDEFRSIMQALVSDQIVVGLNLIPGITDSLDMLLDQLERCQKALNSYLEEKRGAFPRFFFLGDDDLLEILGQSTNIPVVCSHLKKVFSGIAKLKTTDDDKTDEQRAKDRENDPEGNCKATGVFSDLGEHVSLSKPVKVTKSIEAWLENLQSSTTFELQQQLGTAVKEQNPEVESFPGQVLLVKEMVAFTEEVETAIQSSTLSSAKSNLENRLQSFTEKKHKLQKLGRSKLKNMILDLIHNISVVEELMKKKVTNLSDWQWFKQLKYSYSLQRGSKLAIGKASFDYTFEYQGNASKLVHTPLTDKCYLTLTQGMLLGYGGNPYGPAGTGKTESVKALGGAFGRQVLVFNCDEGIDYQSMARIFTGLVRCGSWGCFDEFNRLKEDQLSAVSQQIQVIQNAIKNEMPRVELLGRDINVDKNAGIFVTMNPAGKGYGGRSKLPDNLKQLFRPVAMSRPDNELIAQALLYSEGFKSGASLAKKVVSLFTFSSQLLSSQQHYDWGLRALKTILVVTGELMQKVRDAGEAQTEKKEAELLIQAVRVNTLSKLTFADSKKFSELLASIFIGVEVQDVEYADLEAKVKEVLAEKQLEYDQRQVNKIKQFYEATRQRMGVVLIGPSGCGKTTIWQILRESLKRLGEDVKLHVMNPKSVSRTMLLGFMNHDTREFNDGILTSVSKTVQKENDSVSSWIICDGDVDPEWIESLNSVLDDNHLLTLPNGERISFGPNVNFIFETHDLQFASPATISRMGMIYLNNEDINLQGLTKAWLRSIPSRSRTFLEKRMLDRVGKVSKLLLKVKDAMPVPSTMVGQLNIFLSQMAGVKSEEELGPALVRGITSAIKTEKREEAVTLIAQIFGVEGLTLETANAEPISGSTTTVDRTTMQKNVDDSIVLTPEVRARINTIMPWVRGGKPFLIAGPEGCGKETIVRGAFDQMEDENVKIVKVHCSSQLSAKQVIELLGEHCVKASVASGRILRPRDCSRLVIFFKDLNLPKPDKYSTTEVISLLQQIFTYNGFYDQNLEYLSLDKNIQFVASLNPIGTYGRYSLSERFTAIVNILYIDYLENKELKQVFFKVMKTAVTDLGFTVANLKDQSLVKNLTIFICETYSFMVKNFIAQKFQHYIFTPSDVIQAIDNIKTFKIEKEEDFPCTLYTTGSQVFGNRLASSEDKTNFKSLLDKKFKNVFAGQAGKIGFDLIFSSLVEGGEGPRRLQVCDKAKYLKKLESEKIGYEKEHEPLDLYFSQEFVDLALDLEHLLVQNQNTLLVGQSGNGRRTAAKYVSYLLGFEYRTLYMSQNYSERDFKKDIKKVLEQTGVLNQKVVLLLEDQHFECEANLDLVNTFLASGDFPNVFKEEEIEQALGKEGVEALKRESTSGGSLYDCFLRRLETNLKLVVSLDHSSDKFLVFTSSNPSLMKACGIIWTNEWSPQSKMEYFKSKLHSCEEDRLRALEEDKFLQTSLVKIHRACKSPNQLFFTFITQFLKAFRHKLSNMGSRHSHLKSGLQKISSTNEQVAELSKEAEIKREELRQKEKEAGEALNFITNSMQEASVQKAETVGLKKFLKEEEGKIKGTKDQVESQLADIKPIIETAKKDLNSVQRKDLQEIVQYKTISEHILNVFKALMRLMGEYNNSLSSIKQFVKQRNIMDQILNFNVKKVSEKNRNEAEKVIKKNPSSFERATIFNISKAAGPLALYVVALVKLCRIMLKVRPLQEQLDSVEEKLAESKSKLKNCEANLKDLDQKVVSYKKQHTQKLKEAETLKKGLVKVESTLERATNLLSKLTDEEVRWKSQLKTISEEVKNLPLSSLLSASFCTFLGDKDEVTREKNMGAWSRHCKGTKFSFINFGFSESMTLQWKSEGHPSDLLSVQNTGIYLQTAQTPLIIDPSTRIISWIKQRNKEDKKFEAVSFADSKFATHFELAIRFGKILVVEEVNSLEGMFYPMLRGDLVRIGARRAYLIGDKVIDYGEGFRLILATRDVTLDVSPKARAMLSTINYSVTKSGLEMQLLSLVVNHEKPELEKRKTEILKKEENLKLELAAVEEQLLQELVASSGNILENKKLIESLEASKASSTTISTSLQESQTIQEDIDKERNFFRELSGEGARFYLLLKEVSNLSHMHRYSLQFFLKTFLDTLEGDRPEGDSQQDQLIAGLTSRLFKNLMSMVCSGLSNKLRSSIVLFLIHGAQPLLFEKNEWEFFMGELVDTGAGGRVPQWVPETSMEEFKMFSSFFEQLSGKLDIVGDGSGLWKKWVSDPECESAFGNISTEISGFQKVIFTKMLRAERTQNAVQNFLVEVLGSKRTLFPKFDLSRIYRENSSPETPILFIISPGSDPSAELESFAKTTLEEDKNLQILSMGGGRNQAALNMLASSAEKGGWVFLTNLHLVPETLLEIEKLLSSVEKHADFRFWATTEEHENFPAILLERCFKVYYETPPGIKKNIERAYSLVDASLMQQNEPYSQLVFVLTYFHSIVQERRNYVPQGWSKAYEFSYADFKAAFQLFETLNAKQVDDSLLHTYKGLLELAIYGGRIDSNTDMLVLKTYLDRIFKKSILSGGEEIAPGIQYPNSSSIDQQLKCFESLPETDSPESFGLPKSADISKQKYEAKLLIENLRTMKSGKSKEIEFDKAVWKKGLINLVKLWKELFQKVREAGPAEFSESEMASSNPIESFLVSEISSKRAHIERLYLQIQQLVKVIKGELPLTTELKELGISLLVSQVPEQWLKVWEGSTNPIDWSKSYYTKLLGMYTWLDKCQNQGLLSSVVSLADLFSPEIFLNAHRMIVAKESKEPMETLKLVLSFEKPQIKTTFLKIGGLLIQGCSVEAGKVVSLAQGEKREYIKIPTCYISYSTNDKNGEGASQEQDDGLLSVPLYSDFTREELICHFDIRIDGGRADKIISGVAMSING